MVYILKSHKTVVRFDVERNYMYFLCLFFGRFWVSIMSDILKQISIQKDTGKRNLNLPCRIDQAETGWKEHRPGDSVLRKRLTDPFLHHVHASIQVGEKMALVEIVSWNGKEVFIFQQLDSWKCWVAAIGAVKESSSILVTVSPLRIKTFCLIYRERTNRRIAEARVSQCLYSLITASHNSSNRLLPTFVFWPFQVQVPHKFWRT